MKIQKLNEGIVHNADHVSMSISDILKKNGIDYVEMKNSNDCVDIEFYSKDAALKASKIDWESAGFGHFKVDGVNAKLNINESKSIKLA